MYQDKCFNGKVCVIEEHFICVILVYIPAGGASSPRDAPVPSITTSSLAEIVIAGVVSSIGILSTITFLIFNHCYNKHP